MDEKYLISFFVNDVQNLLDDIKIERWGVLLIINFELGLVISGLNSFANTP